MMQFEELEFKYRADDISLTAFRALMDSRPAVDIIRAASWDIYYVNVDDPDSFQRLRLDKSKPELTKKVKKVSANNWERIESDLPLDPRLTTEEKVAFHVGLDGYQENFRIYKICDVYVFRNLNYVYYVVYNEDLKESGRFIEVEVNKSSSLSHDIATDVLRQGEGILSKLGISPQNRLKKSLFELYRRVL